MIHLALTASLLRLSAMPVMWVRSAATMVKARRMVVMSHPPSKYSLDINSDGSLSCHSDSYPDMKLIKKSFSVAAPSSKYEGSEQSIVD